MAFHLKYLAISFNKQTNAAYNKVLVFD